MHGGISVDTMSCMVGASDSNEHGMERVRPLTALVDEQVPTAPTSAPATSNSLVTDGPPARSRMTASERRATILLAAGTEFARRGYHGASTSRIAKTAGCSEPMLYKHFTHKMEIFSAKLEEVSELLDTHFDEMLEMPGNMIDNWQAYLAPTLCDPDVGKMLSLRTLAVTIVADEQVACILRDTAAQQLMRIDRAVTRAQAAGWMRTDIEPEYVAWLWSAVLHSACFRAVISDDGFAAMVPVAERFLEGLRP